MMRYLKFMPLVLFAGLAIVLAVSLMQPVKKSENPLIGKRMPDFMLPQLGSGNKYITPARMKGEVVAINFFASWCAPCRAEQADLMTLVQKTGVPVYGFSYKDDIKATKNFLTEMPNPYIGVAIDAKGQTAMNFGVTGVPETFIIGRDGTIVYRLSGPLTTHEMNDVVIPLLKKLGVTR